VALEYNGQPHRAWRARARARSVRHGDRLMRQRLLGEPLQRRRRPYSERPGRRRFPSRPPPQYGTAPRQGASARWHRSARVADMASDGDVIEPTIDTSTHIVRLIRNIVGSIAEFEGDTILNRTMAGRRRKLARGELSARRQIRLHLHPH
jgi:hypothetical protein